MHGGHAVSEYGQPVDYRLAQGTDDFRNRGATSYQEPVTYARETALSTSGVNVPSDRHHRYPKHVSSQDKIKISAVASRSGADKGSRVSSRNRRTVTPPVFMTEKTESDKTLVKRSPGINTGVTVTSAVGLPPCPEKSPELLLDRGSNSNNIEIYATLRRKNRQQKTAQQHYLETSNVRQRSSHSGISDPSDYALQSAYDQAYLETRHPRREDKIPLPPHGALSHLKISWLVIDSCLSVCLSVCLSAFMSLLAMLAVTEPTVRCQWHL